MILNANEVKALAIRLGADTVGIAKAEPVANPRRFVEWLDAGHAGDMSYLSKYKEQRFDPGLLLPGAQSIIVIGKNYYPAIEDMAAMQTPFKVARYAWGLDYHDILRKMLNHLRTALRKSIPDLKARTCVDTAPFMDKYWAQKAGLGWQGKHSNIVSKEYGNWFVIGSLVIDAPIDSYDKMHSDHCGKCTACIEACPTGAIKTPYMLNAVKCTSYWTIEAKSKKIHDDMTEKMQNWVFGCDICISVCPFNRFQKPNTERAFSRLEGTGLVETGEVIRLSDSQFAQKYKRSPIFRPGLKGLKRNISALTKSK
ncbi:MAG: tRNA epoxyqueuosine(34) reductase QueG [Candidatus Zixiibacteriota bacterium]